MGSVHWGISPAILLCTACLCGTSGLPKSSATDIGPEGRALAENGQEETAAPRPARELNVARQAHEVVTPTHPAEVGQQVVDLQPRQHATAIVDYGQLNRAAVSETPHRTLRAQPVYKSKRPLYAEIPLGDAPDNRITVVLDEAEGELPRIYIDRNNDKDLTNDGDGRWSSTSGDTLDLSNVVIEVSYKTGKIPYAFQFFRFKKQGEFVFFRRDAWREGELTSGGKTYKLGVFDDNADGRFDDFENGILVIDLNRDGKLVGSRSSAEYHKLGEPFNIHGDVWEVALVTPDGLKMVLRPSQAKVAMKLYLDPGCPALPFTGAGLDGRSIDLREVASGADLVLLDFWASWCGPCRTDFPTMSHLHARYKNHGLRMVGISLDKDREAAQKAVKDAGLDYPHVFDGKGGQNSVVLLYRVWGIPETYLLDKQLKIIAVGLRGKELERRIGELLGPGDNVIPVPAHEPETARPRPATGTPLAASTQGAITAEGLARLQKANQLTTEMHSLMGARRYKEAAARAEEALRIHREVLGDGHPFSTHIISLLGFLYQCQGQYDKAVPVVLKAVEIYKKTSTPGYISSLNHLASLYFMREEFPKAEQVYFDALQVAQNTFGERAPECANTLENLASLYYVMRADDKTLSYSSRAAEIREKTAMTVLAGASEAEALRYASSSLFLPDYLLSASRRAASRAADVYEHVWAPRGMVLLAMARRQDSLRSVLTPRVRAEYQRYLQVRRELAVGILSPAETDPNKLRATKDRLDSLDKEKERLERDLAGQVPELQRQLEAQRRSHTELSARLPREAVFIDFVRYSFEEQDPRVPGQKGRRWTTTYAAFLLASRRPVARVELGPAAPIDTAVTDWRKAIASAGATTAPEQLRRLLWEPVEKQLGAEVRTVYLCADGPLTALPWSAIPGQSPDSVVLERYAVAVVPSGQFLLEKLLEQPTATTGLETVLAVGDVAYDVKPQEAVSVPTVLAKNSRAATPQNRQLHWAPLAGTRIEIEGMAATANERKVIRLTGVDASTTRVVAELPRASWVHFATHGFFADPSFRSMLCAEESLFEQGSLSIGRERRTVAGRNPLALSGLVLAGANWPRTKDGHGMLDGDRGILTAEAIAGLDMSRLQVVVLSACDTGLGDIAGGEGVLGLQRAFHLAGSRNVIASLWKLDDDATAALMKLFYRNVWGEKMPPIEGLRQAQLHVFRRPDLIHSQAATRGPAFDQPTKLPTGVKTAPVRQWGAFVLSGVGR